MSTTLDELKRMVNDLWPRYRANVYPMWNTVLCRYDLSQVRTALTHQRATDPDGTKPIWALIYARLTAEASRATALKAIETNRQAAAEKAKLVGEIEAAWFKASQAERDAALQEYNANLPARYQIEAPCGMHASHVKRRLYERQ